LDQVEQNFKEEESKMEKKVEVLETQNADMKTENADMKKQLDEQATEIKAIEQKEQQGEAHQVKVEKVQAAKQATASIAAAVKKTSTVAAVKETSTVAAVKKTAVKATVAKVATTVAKVVKVAEVAKVVKAVKAKANKVIAYATKPWEATFSVHLDGKDKGKEETFTVRVHPEWAPEGAKRFQDMLQAGILDDARFFRVVPGFMVQFGIAASPKVAAVWEHKRIQDDPVMRSNYRGMMTFATSGPNTRTTQMFINYANNDFLDKQGFSPFAEVINGGMKVVSRIQSKYKEKPNQGKVQHHGNKYLKKHCPDLSFVGHVASSLTGSTHKAAGFIQDSETPVVMANGRKYRYNGIATVYHQKAAVGH